ncbi:MAG: TetR family transcriptional regulator [Verrucomicrobiota bacterium]|nr:TetR family transcriptional regulator [Verrucomicrobiota bacterium]
MKKTLPVAPARNGETKTAILNAAERLFAAHGFNATSLRAITAEAQANLGAVNYHFASKDALILAVLRRRVQPSNEERIALLDCFEKDAAGQPLTIERILEALFRPPTELVARGAKGGRYLVRLMALALAEPGSVLQPLIQEEFAEKNRRFHAAIRRAVPYLSSDEVHWRLHFAHGVFLHAVAHSNVLELSSNGRCRHHSVEGTLRRMIGFCAAGIAARENVKRKKTK